MLCTHRMLNGNGCNRSFRIDKPEDKSRPRKDSRQILNGSFGLQVVEQRGETWRSDAEYVLETHSHNKKRFFYCRSKLFGVKPEIKHKSNER